MAPLSPVCFQGRSLRLVTGPAIDPNTDIHLRGRARIEGGGVEPEPFDGLKTTGNRDQVRALVCTSIDETFPTTM